MSARVSSKVATNCSFRGKRISKINIFEAIILNQNKENSKAKTEEWNQNNSSDLNCSGLLLDSSATYSMKMSASVSLRVVTNMVFLKVKSYESLAVLRLFSKGKRE